MIVQDQYKIYNNLTTLGRFIVNNHNFNTHSVELYAMLEIELNLFSPSRNNNNNNSNMSAKDVNSGDSSSSVPIAFDTIQVPVICCAEHTVPSLANVA